MNNPRKKSSETSSARATKRPRTTQQIPETLDEVLPPKEAELVMALSTKNPVWERSFVGNADTYPDLAPYIIKAEAMGWGSIIRRNIGAYLPIVMDFYIALCADPDATEITVRGVQVPVTTASLAQTLGLERYDLPDEDGNQKICPLFQRDGPENWNEIKRTIMWKNRTWASEESHRGARKDLLPAARVWLNFIAYTLYGVSSLSQYKSQCAQVLALVMRGEKFDIARMLMGEIRSAALNGASRKTSIRFPTTISQLCTQSGVPNTDCVWSTTSNPPRINKGVLCTILGVPVHSPIPATHVEGYIQEEEEEDVMQDPPRHAGKTDFEGWKRTMERRMDRQDKMLELIMQRMQIPIPPPLEEEDEFED